MADAVGMFRLTLESYMKRENAALPGLEALCQIARGLGVSLDWLAGVGAMARIRESLVARVSAGRAALPVITTLITTLSQGKPAPEPEFLAIEIGAQAAQFADVMHQNIITSLQMAKLLKGFETAAEDVLKQKNAALRAEIDRLSKQLDMHDDKGKAAE